MTVDRPEFRISDAEREEAMDALGQHMRDGRLDIDEYGDRTARVTAAKTRGELVTLFSDLPEPRPAMLREQLPAPPEQGNRERDRRRPREGRSYEPRRRRTGLPGGAVPIAIAAAIGLVLLLRIPMPMLLIPIVVVVLGAFGARCWPGRD
ncbi:DUF1707 domain-containing protein [Haloechinothrix salitolerans]|uniref:DUF1707 domain-containing protein n=1 Tax=Haloechinothrix salitolerans TaxID=926830 RepID=A0ABW2C9C4_9PSEU